MTTVPSPEIAVIIPTFNRRQLLPNAIDSIFAQTHSNFELIVVDDCSSDDTPNFLSLIVDPRFKWHRFDRHRHANAARNCGAAMSLAPILTFLDSDDSYYPSRLRDVLTLFRQHPEVDVHLSSFISTTNSGSTPCINPDAIFTPEELERYLVGYCLFLGGSGVSIRRHAFNEVGRFDEGLTRMQDRDLLLRIARSRGCASTSKVNWSKSRSPDSLSRQSAGQITSLFELRLRHPIIQERYPDLFRYLIAREVVRKVLNLRFGDAINAIKEVKSGRNQFQLSQVPHEYFIGKRLRRVLKAEISEFFEDNRGSRPTQKRTAPHGQPGNPGNTGS